ncbi:kinase-like protein [Phanerochaete sordida]|uniref:Kinase-like protein n=1 Tax=Phanerochaete sordida TaxID=48140 RepID=A0A9P3G2C5_9APHY|nr:kinase-like protein [Phanerochaete sordida]
MHDLRLPQVDYLPKKLGSVLRSLNRIFTLFDSQDTSMAPALGPDIQPMALSLGRGQGSSPYSAPVSSLSLGGSSPSIRTTSRSSSSLSIPFDDEEVDVVRVEGLRHAEGKLEARRYKTPAFAQQLLTILHALRIPTWNHRGITPDIVKIQKVSGSLTNAVYFVSCPSIPHTSILLLRIYGPSSGNLISRPRELHILHALSSRYHIGPRVYGTFENGRVEEYFDSSALTAADLRNGQISGWIGARMAELHQVDINAVELHETPSCSHPPDAHPPRQLGVEKNVKSWLPLAREVLSLPAVSDEIRQTLALDQFEHEWTRYMAWLQEWEGKHGKSPVVFAHNDTQYGNLLKMSSVAPGSPEHHQIIVVDFEYASPNPAAFDIANHFQEWTADYHGATPHILDPSRYPTSAQRFNFYHAYLTHYEPSVASTEPLPAQEARLEAQVGAWSPASHGMWALWGIVQAREALDGTDGEPEFDYVGYALCRMEGFRRELRALAI